MRRLERTRRPHVRLVPEAPQARSPRDGGYDPTPPASGPMPGRARVYASQAASGRRRLCPERSPQSGSWAGRDAGWAARIPQRPRPPQTAGPARRAAAGRRWSAAGTAGPRPGLSVQAYLCAGERKRREGSPARAARSAVLYRGWGRGARSQPAALRRPGSAPARRRAKYRRGSATTAGASMARTMTGYNEQQYNTTLN